jgi:hypothetical protein
VNRVLPATAASIMVTGEDVLLLGVLKETVYVETAFLLDINDHAARKWQQYWWLE